MQLRAFSLLLVLAFFNGTSLFAQRPAGIYYVGANAGLNLRASASANSEKLDLAQYAEQVEILKPAPDQSMTVDGITGGMAQVKVGGKTGYMFDGYLVRFILPTKGEEVETYAGRLWASQADVLHEEHRKDYGGYASMEYAIHFMDMSWAEAFIIAKNLYGIPAPLQFPGNKGKGSKVSKNPNAREGAWSDELEAVYGPSGDLMSITYVFRGEGGGTSIRIEPSTDQNYKFKVYETDIAD